ncbi:MAG: zinc-ribbon domain-containing protein [Eubacteriales bacterium]
MKFCSKCGKEIMDEAVVCPNCGCPVADQNNSKDQVNIGLCIVSALIPCVGIIWWIAKRKENPKEAKACGIVGIVAFIIYMILLSI